MKKLNIQKSSIILWGMIMLLLIVVMLSVTMRRNTTPMELPPGKASPVDVQPVSLQPVHDKLQLPGRIVPDVRAMLAVDKGGRVTELHADKGDSVEKGQMLLRIEDRVWRALLEQAEIEWREAEKEYKRWIELMETGAVSPSEFDVVRTRYDRAQVQLTEAKVHVEQCEVRSPADGIINERLVEIGEFAPEGGAVFEWVVTDPVRVRLDVPERDLHVVESGGPLSFTISAIGVDTVFEAIVTHVAEAANPQNNSFRVDATLPNPDRQLRPGMIATVSLVRDRRDAAVVVPLSAVIPRKGEHFVFVASGERAVRRLVKLDRIMGHEVSLASGLDVGEELIVDGHRELIDGALIKRINGAAQE